jgi:hypothetical protein
MTIGLPAENDRFLTALRDAVAPIGSGERLEESA